MQRNNLLQERITLNKPSPTKLGQHKRRSPQTNLNNNHPNINRTNSINTSPIKTLTITNSPELKSTQTVFDKDFQDCASQNERLRQQLFCYLFPTNLKLSSRHLNINRDQQISRLLRLYKAIDENSQQIMKLEKKMQKLSESKKIIMNIKSINLQLHQLLSQSKGQNQSSNQ